MIKSVTTCYHPDVLVQALISGQDSTSGFILGQICNSYNMYAMSYWKAVKLTFNFTGIQDYSIAC
jgi:hypothetical protein